jgi:hypothetical protein
MKEVILFCYGPYRGAMSYSRSDVAILTEDGDAVKKALEAVESFGDRERIVIAVSKAIQNIPNTELIKVSHL